MCKWCLMISFTHSRNLLCVNDALWFHLHIVDLPNAIWRVFFCYKDIRRKAFFTMTTLLMPLLENGCSIYIWATTIVTLENLYICSVLIFPSFQDEIVPKILYHEGNIKLLSLFSLVWCRHGHSLKLPSASRVELHWGKKWFHSP